MSTSSKKLTKPTPATARKTRARRNPEAEEMSAADQATMIAWQASYDNARKGKRLDSPDRQSKGRRRLNRDAKKNNPITVTVAGSKVVTRSPKRMSGTPVFANTRVPVKTLFDYLAGGYSLDVFFDHFPDVTPEQVSTLLDEIGEQLNERAK